MCFIETFTNVYPNGFRELSDRLICCRYGTPSAPCNDKPVIHTNEEHLVPFLGRPRAPSPYPIPSVRSESPANGKKKKKNSNNKKPAGVMCYVNFHIPGTSRKDPEGGRTRDFPRRQHPRPPGGPLPVPPRPLPPPVNPSQGHGLVPRPSPQLPIRPVAPPPSRPHQRSPPIIIQMESTEDEDVRPRMHRRPRSPNPSTGARNLRRLARERDLRHRAEDDARQAEERRIQAQREVARIRHERDRAREHIIEQDRREVRRRRQREEEEARLDHLDRIEGERERERERERCRRIRRELPREVFLHQRRRDEFEMEERGARVILDAILDGRLRRDERTALDEGLFRRVHVSNIPGRWRTVGGGRERVVYDDEPGRPGRRWI
ncbi:hypothetical protein MMC08_001800 [Hypocenomyce scalaris]|nr:hypothetical protein [Hypocenomyce scalaris]